MSAVLFGSISTTADTSELQREAFNRAFDEHGLDWHWDQDTYRAMLEKSGGASRIAEYAESRGETVDATAVHETKSRLFQESLATSALSARPGVVETIHDAKRQGLKVGLVTTTSEANISALLSGLGPDVRIDDFDLVVDAADVEQPKPDKAAYVYALRTLGEAPQDCVAIEDNVGGVQAATAAGITCVAFPNENTAQHDFADADRRVDRVSLAELQQLIAS